MNEHVIYLYDPEDEISHNGDTIIGWVSNKHCMQVDIFEIEEVLRGFSDGLPTLYFRNFPYSWKYLTIAKRDEDYENMKRLLSENV